MPSPPTGVEALCPLMIGFGGDPAGTEGCRHTQAVALEGNHITRCADIPSKYCLFVNHVIER